MNLLTITKKERLPYSNNMKARVIIDDINEFEINNDSEISIELENGQHRIFVDYVSCNIQPKQKVNTLAKKLLQKTAVFTINKNSSVNISFGYLGISLKSTDIIFSNKLATSAKHDIEKQSVFTGGLLGLIGISLLQGIIIVFSLGIATPWAICKKESWIADHTIIDGKRLIFTGRGGNLFKKFIVWALLTLVTLGIYGFWLTIKMKRWVVEHTHFVEE